MMFHRRSIGALLGGLLAVTLGLACALASQGKMATGMDMSMNSGGFPADDVMGSNACIGRSRAPSTVCNASTGVTGDVKGSGTKGTSSTIVDILQQPSPDAQPSSRGVVAFVAVVLLLGYAVHRILNAVRTLLALAKRKQSAPFEGFDYFVPNPHWYLGHVGVMGKHNFFSNIRKLCIDHANPSNGISTFWFFSVPSVSVMRSKDAQKVLNACFHRENPPSLEKHFKAFAGENSLLAANGAEWMTNRKIVHRAFIPAALREMQASVCGVAQRGVDTILRQMREQQPSGEGGITVGNSQCEVSLTMLRVFKLVTLDIVGISVLGHDFRGTTNFLTNSVVEAYEFLAGEFNRRLFDEAWNPAAQHYWIPTPNNFRHWRANAKIRNYLGELIRERRKEVFDSGAVKKDLLGRLIGSSADSDELSDEYLSDFLVTILVAGLETTSVALSYAFYLLATNPECQENCFEEVEKVLGPASNMPESFHWSQLPYCRAVLLESLRLYPPGPQTMRTLDKPLELDGFTFPRGARVYMFMWWIHRDPENFARPLEFLPERWVSLVEGKLEPHESRWAERTPERERNIGIDSTASDAIPVGDKKANLAFSGGGRSCVGERFAMQSATITLATFIKELKVRTVPGYVLQNEKEGTALHPSHGLPLLLSKR